MSQRPLSFLLLLLAPLLVPAPATAQDWSNLGGNGPRNGRSITVGPTSADLLWSNATDFSIIAWHPFVDDDRVFAIRESGFPQSGGAANDALVAYDLASGAELWRTTPPYNGNPSEQWIAWIGGARDGRVYVGRSENGKPNPVRAFDAASGALLWTSTATTQQFAYDGFVFAPDDGDPIVGDHLSLVRINADDGTTAWNVPRSRAVSGNCGAAVTASALYVDTVVVGGQRVQRRDLATGALSYEGPTMPGLTEQNAPFVAPDGTVYFARTQNNASVDFLYAFEDTGSALVLKWQRPVRWTTSHEHGIGADGSVYTFLATNEFVRLDPATGNVTATAGVLPTIGTGNLSPKTAVDANGNVYVSNGWAGTPATNGRLWAFDADLAVNHFTLTTNNPNAGGPALGRDGTLVVADRNGVRAYRNASSPTTSFCAGDGVFGFCPCGNHGELDHGCDNSAATGGARLSGSGQASLSSDGFVLTTTGELPSVTSIVLQGDVDLGAPVVFGDGIRCVGGNLKRLYVRSAENGVVVVPTGGEAPVSVQSSALGDPIGAGQSRSYQVYYRDPDLAFCPAPPGNTWNVSQALRVTWTP